MPVNSIKFANGIQCFILIIILSTFITAIATQNLKSLLIMRLNRMLLTMCQCLFPILLPLRFIFLCFILILMLINMHLEIGDDAPIDTTNKANERRKKMGTKCFKLFIANIFQKKIVKC